MAKLETEDLPGVEILAAVGPIHGHGSPPEGNQLTVAHLEEFAANAAELAGEIRPPLKIGHSQAQALARASGLADDEQPALGWVENVRVQGDKLVADLRAVPKKLAGLVRSGAFRTRSVEFRTGYQSQATGKRYGRVLTGLALLGAKAPAVKTLDDIVALYGDHEPDDQELRSYDWTPAGVPAIDVRLAVIGPDDVVISLDELARRESGGRADTRGDMTDLNLNEEAVKTLAERLGLEGEIDEAKLLAAAEARQKELADAKAAAEKPQSDDGKKNQSDDGTVRLSDSDLKQLQEKAAAGERAERRLQELERDQTIDQAVREGRVEPAQRERFQRLYDTAPDETVKLLAELPVNELFLSQYGDDSDGVSPEDRQKERDRVFAEHAALVGIRKEDWI